jgi:hypothetical protein
MTIDCSQGNAFLHLLSKLAYNRLSGQPCWFGSQLDEMSTIRNLRSFHLSMSELTIYHSFGKFAGFASNIGTLVAKADRGDWVYVRSSRN